MKKLFLFLLFPFLLQATKWTVLVYMAADNDLSSFADSDLVEMEAVGSNADLSIILQLDKPGIGCRRLAVLKDTVGVIGNLGVIDMCDWQTLYEFLDWGIREFPADRYFVILWDHGTGWTAQPRRSFGSDQSSGNQMSIAGGDFQKAIRYLYNSVGRKINLFAFDACAMQEVEIGYEIKDYAQILLAVQGVWPLAGFPYDRILQVIKDKPGTNETELAIQATRLCRDEYVDLEPNAVSAVRLDRFAGIKQAWSDLGAEMTLGLPGLALQGVREMVQTLPEASSYPRPTDDYVDLGSLINGLSALYPGKKIETLKNSYQSAIVESAWWGDGFAGVTGLTAWFPYEYSHFKQMVGSYLGLDWTGSSWPRFLNWYYNCDDIRPTAPVISASEAGRDNDFRLSWTKSFDLAPVTYKVLEAEDTARVFFDACEDSSLWDFSGFALSNTQYHSGSFSFFSGNASNLANTMETKGPVTIENLGLLDLYLNYNTQDRTDSLIIECGPFRDVHYGLSAGWINRRVVLPTGTYPLKITYRTDASTNLGGCFVDDIRVSNLTAGRYIRSDFSDTTLRVFNKIRGDYYYAVQPVDRYANFGDVSDFVPVALNNFAQPYSLPNPFQDGCYLVLDYPDGLQPQVHVISLSGREVRTFGSGSIVYENKRVYWDGRDNEGRTVGAGIYFLLVEDGSFKKLGKIARQR